MTKFTPAAKHLGPAPFGSDDSRLVLRPVVAGWVAVLGDCPVCEQPFDAGYCPRCEHFAHEMPPEKPLSQWKAEHPEIVAEIQAWIAECFPCRPDPFGGPPA
jgi:hypothetical protein